MKRRLLLSAAFSGGIISIASAALAQPRYTVSAAQLQQSVARRFPLRYAMRGLLEVTIREPQLRLLPELDRIATRMDVVVEGPALQRPSTGEFDIDFGLRYERSDQTIRARNLRVRSLRVADLPEPYPGLLDAFRDVLAQQAFGEIVLHRLTQKDLGLAGTMGLEPDTIMVTADGLVITFAPRRSL